MKWVKYDCNGDEQVWYSENEYKRLEKENVEIKTSYINFIAKLKQEMITKDDIQDLKDTAKRFVEERNSLRKENAKLKQDIEAYKQSEQEATEIIAELKEEVKQLHNGRNHEELYTLFGKPIKYWEELKAENERLKSCLQEIKSDIQKKIDSEVWCNPDYLANAIEEIIQKD